MSRDNYYQQKWTVESFTTRGKEYVVSLTRAGEWQCSCPVWKFRRQICKHILAIQDNRDVIDRRRQERPTEEPRILLDDSGRMQGFADSL